MTSPLGNPRHWQPDRPNCQLCDAGFNLLRRRHHCRACGIVCCDECAPDKALVLPAVFGCGELPQRVCYGCVVQLPNAPAGADADVALDPTCAITCTLCHTPFHLSLIHI